MCCKHTTDYSKNGETLPVFDWDEIKKHCEKTDRWLVIKGLVYDITKWAKRHPGGERIISHFAGEDATDAWVAFHNHRDDVTKYMNQYLIGRIDEKTTPKQPAWVEDFRELRQKTEEMNLYQPSLPFFTLLIGQIFMFEALGWLVMWQFGTGWVPWVVAAVFMVTAQAQGGWIQHDLGHLSLFKSSHWNHVAHIFILNFMKGASSGWWNYRHNQHHAKPNVIRKDPDIRLDYFFILGKTLPVEWGQKKKGFMAYKHQHLYWHVTIAPFLLPVYFNYEIPYFMISRQLWNELFWFMAFFVRYTFMFSGMLGYVGVFGFYFFIRLLESHWFVWTTQLNHIPMEVEFDKREDWVTMQLKATCNVDPSLFNDWFTGHLNFQIEHHLFPTMPRSSYYQVRPLVRAFCKKHKLPYETRPLWQGMCHIINSLEKSGKLWAENYYK